MLQEPKILGLSTTRLVYQKRIVTFGTAEAFWSTTISAGLITTPLQLSILLYCVIHYNTFFVRVHYPLDPLYPDS
jgi:hypothetical protein